MFFAFGNAKVDGVASFQGAEYLGQATDLEQVRSALM
jgi:hypothetical protein